MTIKELKEQRTKLLLDAQGILVANPDAEKRASALKMVETADQIEADVTVLEKIETEQRRLTTPARPNPEVPENAAVTKEAAEKRAFSDYIRFGKLDSGQLTEARDLTTTTAGAYIPQGFYPNLVESRQFYGNILNVITNMDVDSGAPTKVGTVSDIANLLSVVGEAVSVSEVDPTVGGFTITTDWLTTGVIKVSIPELRDSAFNLDEWIKSAFGKRYYRGLSKMVTQGSSSGNIGSIKTGTSVGRTTTAPTAISWADIVALYASLDIAYEPDAVFSMNGVTRGVLLGTVDSTGRPLYVTAVTAGAFDTILGHKVVINPYMDNPTAGLTPVLYGAHDQYLLRTVKPGLAIARLNEVYLPSGEVGFIGFASAGGALLTAGTAPIVSLLMHA